MALACGFFIVVGVGLIAKSFNRGKTIFLKLFLLSNMIFCGLGYLAGHVLLNIYLILVLLFPDIPVISNHPVAGSMKVIVFSTLSHPVLSVTV